MVRDTTTFPLLVVVDGRCVVVVVVVTVVELAVLMSCIIPTACPCIGSIMGDLIAGLVVVRGVVVDVFGIADVEIGVEVVVVVLVILGVVDFILVKGASAFACIESSTMSSFCG